MQLKIRSKIVASLCGRKKKCSDLVNYSLKKTRVLKISIFKKNLIY